MEEVLDAESYQQLIRFRRDVYRGGAYGFIGGMILTAAYHAGRMLTTPSFKSSNKNIMVGSLFLCASGGSFLGAHLGGKYSLYNFSNKKYNTLTPHPSQQSEYSKIRSQAEQDRVKESEDSYSRRIDAIRKTTGVSSSPDNK
jgi:hypothetical protein